MNTNTDSLLNNHIYQADNFSGGSVISLRNHKLNHNVSQRSSKEFTVSVKNPVQRNRSLKHKLIYEAILSKSKKKPRVEITNKIKQLDVKSQLIINLTRPKESPSEPAEDSQSKTNDGATDYLTHDLTPRPARTKTAKPNQPRTQKKKMTVFSKKIDELEKQLIEDKAKCMTVFQHKQKGYGQIKYDPQQLNRAILDQLKQNQAAIKIQVKKDEKPKLFKVIKKNDDLQERFLVNGLPYVEPALLNETVTSRTGGKYPNEHTQWTIENGE